MENRHTLTQTHKGQKNKLFYADYRDIIND